MTPSWRKPVGMLLILALIMVWVIAVASLSRIVGGWPTLVQLGFYLVTGIVWLWAFAALGYAIVAERRGLAR